MSRADASKIADRCRADRSAAPGMGSTKAEGVQARLTKRTINHRRPMSDIAALRISRHPAASRKTNCTVIRRRLH